MSFSFAPWKGCPSALNIRKVLGRKAAESTANYVERHMKNVNSVTSTTDLLSLALQHVDQNNETLICEFGVYSGRTINHIAALTNKLVYGFDSFEGLPERWRDGFKEGTFAVKALPIVRANVILIKGWFDKTLPPFLEEHKEQVSFLHIDCDLYSSTKTIFQFLGDRIKSGCVIVFDEYFNYPGWEEGEYKAFQEFVADAGMQYEYISYNSLSEQVAVLIK